MPILSGFYIVWPRIADPEWADKGNRILHVRCTPRGHRLAVLFSFSARHYCTSQTLMSTTWFSMTYRFIHAIDAEDDATKSAIYPTWKDFPHADHPRIAAHCIHALKSRSKPDVISWLNLSHFTQTRSARVRTDHRNGGKITLVALLFSGLWN